MTSKYTIKHIEENGQKLINVTSKRPFLDFTIEDLGYDDENIEAIVELQNKPSYTDVVNSVLLYAPYLYGTQWADLLRYFSEPITGITYGVGAMFKLENPDYKDEQGEGKYGLVTVNKPLTIQEGTTWKSLKDYFDNGIVDMINYSDITRQ